MKTAKRLLALLLVLLMFGGNFSVLTAYADAETAEEPAAVTEPAAEEPAAPVIEETAAEAAPAEETPVPVEPEPPTEAPIPAETPAATETPVPVETPNPVEIPASAETPASTETPAPVEPPVPTETPAPQETLAEEALPLVTDHEISATLRDVAGRTVGTVKVKGLLPEDAVLLAAAEMPTCEEAIITCTLYICDSNGLPVQTGALRVTFESALIGEALQNRCTIRSWLVRDLATLNIPDLFGLEETPISVQAAGYTAVILTDVFDRMFEIRSFPPVEEEEAEGPGNDFITETIPVTDGEEGNEPLPAEGEEPEEEKDPEGPSAEEKIEEEEILSTTIEATDGSSYAISVTYRNTAGIPMTGTALAVSEILPGTEEYENYLKQSAETIGTTKQSIGFARVFDITIVDAEDPAIVYEPADSVDVHIKLFETAQVAAENMDVVHFEGNDYASICESSADGTTLDFSTDSFSIYVVAGYTFEKVISAEDGNTYKMTVTYGEEAQLPDDAALEVAELSGEDYEEYLSRTATLMEAASFEYARIFDISIMNAQGEHLEPAAPVEVKIELIDVENTEKDFSVVHFSGEAEEMEAQTEGNTVVFSTDGFSVYAIVAAPEPFVPGEIQTVQDLTELAANYSDSLGFYLSYSSSHYFTNSLNGNSAFVETSSIDSASPWYFEATGGTNQYYIYTKIDGTARYISNPSGNLAGLTENVSAAVKFDLSNPVTGVFLLKKNGENRWLQHSGSGNGIRFYTDANNTANTRITITYVSSAAVPEDYYGLNGKTYSIAYYEESVKGAGLTDQQSGSKLLATELLVRPDVLNNSGELLISQDSDLTDWTFEYIEGTTYYITTQVGGTTKYLTLGSSISLLDEPTANSRITVESGTGAFAGKYKFSSVNRALTLSGGNAANGFVSSANGGDYVWLSLVTKSPLLDDDDFTVYSAEKADLSNSEQVPDGAEVIVYTRVWNETTLKYEFYAINSDGSLIRCFESGDMIQWVGSTINTAIWQFTEYYEDPDADPLVPNYYYELQNTYNNNCLRPASTGEFLRSVSEYPDYFDRSINLNGRRYGYYYSTILAWDVESYGYIGLRVKDDMSGIETCPMSEADTFFFAIMKPMDEAPEPTSVATVDHEAYGITVRIKDYTTPGRFNGQDTSAEQNAVLGTNKYVAGSYAPGLLSTKLEADGYPMVAAEGYTTHSLGELYSNASTVNHLFIENTYYSSGYYEFDSTQNFASFYNQETGAWDYRNFTVYEELGTNDSKSTESMQHGQFFPYNKLSNEYANNENMYDANGNELPDSNPRKGEKLRLVEDASGRKNTNYYFGTEIEASFTQTVSGLDAWGHDIIYEFTGDDDFWLYVDGELIIDLGGIHSAMGASVNYRTGQVTVNGVTKTLRQIFEENYRGRNPGASDTEVAVFLAEYFNEGETIFKDYTNHTMRIFYMERGAGASNLHMRFNLASVKPGTVELSKQISGVDSTESFMAEYPFQIFFKMQDEETEHPLVPGSSDITVKYKDTTRDVTYRPTFTGADGLTTYSNVFLLRPGETAVVSFPDNAYTYRIVECFVNTDVYEKVLINGEEVVTVVSDGEPVPDEGHYIYDKDLTDTRIDVISSYAEVNSRGRMVFTNQVDPNAKGTLVFVKHLYAEDGVTPIPHAESSTTFTFRLYLGTENTPDDQLPLADMYSYHVKDNYGNYCKWLDGRFVSLGETVYANLTDAEKIAATFTTSMNGTIANIPVDYSVEVREIPAGTKYMVEERDYELPDGYTLQWYVPYRENPSTGSLEITDQTEWGKTPVSGLIANGLGAMIEIRNLKGWGLRVFKEWSDAEWMQSRDPIYFAVYTDDGTGNLTLVEDTVKQLAYGEESAYWFFEKLDSNIPFDRYLIREVILSGGTPAVNEKGLVTNAAGLTITIIPVDGTGEIAINGTQIGDTGPAVYTYKLVDYVIGQLPEGANVREDTIYNKRQGLDLYLTDWAGNALAGGTFSMTDGSGNTAGQDTFTSDENGLITIAYLRDNEDYTLMQTGAPTGYTGLQTALTIRRSGSTITVTPADTSYNDWWTLDDTDIESGVSITYGKVTIKNKPFTLQIRKTQLTADGNPLEGVSFALYRQVTGNNGQPRKDYQPIAGFDSLVTDANGIVPLITAAFADGTLLPGTYYLYETHPVSGFSPLSGDVIFTVSRTGTVTIGSGSPSGVEVQTAGSDTLTVTIAVPNQTFGTAELTVAKMVENGIAADVNGTNKFVFTAKLYLPDGMTPWNYSEGGFTNGTASFSLGHSETRVFTVPLNAVVTVVETANSIFSTDADLDVTNEGETTTSTSSFNTAALMSTVRINDETAVTLTYINTRSTIEITVKKTVVGAGGTFTFTISSEDLENETLADDITADGDSFTLSPGDNGTAQQKIKIPYGAALTITETEDPEYQTSVQVGSAAASEGLTATIAADQTVRNLTVTFTNTGVIIAPTGIRFNWTPYVLILAAGTAMAGISLIIRKRKRGDAE